MSSVVISGDSSGTVSLTVPSVAGTNTATLPAATGTVMVSGNMPAFRAYNSTQSFTSGVTTKQLFATEDFDTNSNFASSRFTPTVAGYYQVNCFVYGGASVSNSTLTFSFFKNGLIGTSGYSSANGFNAAVNIGITGSDIFYCNGTTDYLEVYVTFVGTGTLNTSICTFSGAMVRAA